MPKKKIAATKKLKKNKQKITRLAKVIKTIKTPKKVVLEVPVITISSTILPKRPRKKRGQNASRMYFTQETEDAIVAYNKETDVEKREVIFREKIYLAFQKLVENIFNTFKFSYFETGPQDVQKECLSHLVANIHKFDPNRQSKTNPNNKAKAYSYFSIIAKHHLILLNNTNYKKWLQSVEISEERDEHTVQLQQDDKHYAQQEMNDFIRLLVEFWEKNINKIFTKQRDLNIANAVVELFRKSDRIDAYNKKALYLYIREMAKCKTQQITKVINRMKQYHDTIQRSYIDDGTVNTNRYVSA
jgi:hypothetical protein